MKIFILLYGLFIVNALYSEDISTLRELCIRETAFDYCGLYPDIKTNEVGHTDRELKALLMGNCAYYDFRYEFQDMLESVERYAMQTNYLMVQTSFRHLSSRLLELTKKSRGKQILLVIII